MAPVYVVSTGRAGSTFVARLFSGDGGLTISHQQRGSRALNIIGNLMVAGRISTSGGFALARRFGFDGSATADPLRSMLMTAALGAGLLPRARVVHVVRDPRAFVRSFMNWKDSSLKRRFLHHVVPAWQPNPWLAGEVPLSAWMAMPKFDHFCWVWNYKNALFGSLARLCEYRRVRFEDLTEPGSGKLERLAEFVGVDVPEDALMPERLNASDGLFPEWHDWSAARASVLGLYCGALMTEYGYGREEAWESQWPAGHTRLAGRSAAG